MPKIKTKKHNMKIPFVNSANNYFEQELNVLVENWVVVEIYLKAKGYKPSQVAIYEKAYFYFVQKNDIFDGATMTEDMCDLFNLDLDAMLHDYFYVRYSVSASYHFTQIADQLMYDETVRKRKSSWNAWVRKKLLKLKSIAGFSLWARYIAKRKMSLDDKLHFLMDVKNLKTT